MLLTYPIFPSLSMQEWYPHFFVLTNSKIYYSEETSSNQGNDEEEEHREVCSCHEFEINAVIPRVGLNLNFLEVGKRG